MAYLSKYSIAILVINSLTALCIKHVYTSFIKSFITIQQQTVGSLKSDISDLQNEIVELKKTLDQKNNELDKLKQSHNALLNRIDNFANHSYEIIP